MKLVPIEHKQEELLILEKAMMSEEQVECPLIHRFAPGLYIREVHIPAGTLALGNTQKFEHLNILLKGRVQIVADNGELLELTAPMTFVGKPGRKVGYILEDVIWQNIYPTTETDIDKLEDFYIEKSDYAYSMLANSVSIEYDCREEDRADYLSILNDFGFDEATARSQSENEDDQIPMNSNFGVIISDSQIEGKGVIATIPFESGAIIAPAMINGKRNPIGRYTNHSKNPNCEFVWLDDKNIVIRSLKRIKGCVAGYKGEELTVNYRTVLNKVLFNKEVEKCLQ